MKQVGGEAPPATEPSSWGRATGLPAGPIPVPFPGKLASPWPLHLSTAAGSCRLLTQLAPCPPRPEHLGGGNELSHSLSTAFLGFMIVIILYFLAVIVIILYFLAVNCLVTEYHPSWGLFPSHSLPVPFDGSTARDHPNFPAFPQGSLKSAEKPGAVVLACHLCTWEAEAGGS